MQQASSKHYVGSRSPNPHSYEEFPFTPVHFHTIRGPFYTGRTTPPHLHTTVEDAFASELLIPQAALKAYLPKLPNLSQIFDFKAVHKVSALATVVSLHREDILSDEAYKRRCAAPNQRGFKDDEPNGMPHCERSRIFDQVFDKDSPKFQSRRDVAMKLDLPQDVVDAGTFATKLMVVA